ncbi:MAG: hypothetical protein H0T78_04730 [Longispora sp.]|nr:hypothetical protein [Longispora sp. (in: high G+C Gram-positive bacteria)]
MLAIISAVLFAIALILALTGKSFDPHIDATTLTIAGLLFLALHFTGAATAMSRRRRV